MLCVGIDPDPRRFPAPLHGAPDALVRFCTAIIDATADLVCAFKPQIAHFAALRAEPELEEICQHVRQHHPDVVVVLDAKRGDIGSTAERYAGEVFGRYGADAVTVNPYLGTDAATPFLEHGGVLALCRTSNPGSSELQDLDVGGRPLYQRVAEMVASRWAPIGDCGLVVGATFPDQLGDVRAIVGDLPILVPGIGTQSGDLAASVRLGSTGAGTGLLLSSSREILYASAGEDFVQAARTRAMATRDAIRVFREGHPLAKHSDAGNTRMGVSPSS
jgi:orotidine-5'-phosphate decarboxylase